MQSASGGQPTVTICVPTYNRARHLECLLEDLAANISDVGFSYELLIGDNASDDDTPAIVARYVEQLCIRYIRRPINVGMHPNISKLFAEASGKYVVYLADDDFLILKVLNRHIAYLEDNPEVGAVFAPWLIYDRPAGVDVDQFYVLEHETRLEARDYSALFNLLVHGHIFPEIYIARTTLARRVVGESNPISFVFFLQICAMLDRTAITFSPEPYYRQVIPYFENEEHSHDGHEEVKIGWDRYRGGLEYILAKFASRLSAEELDSCRRAIDRFVQIRMHVALRLRTAEGARWAENYYLANRLRSGGSDRLLPAPYEFYRINAALEYLVALQPFYPEPAQLVYYVDDPPELIAQAQNYADAGLLKVERSQTLPEHAILLTNRNRWSVPTESPDLLVISEAELLARFP